MSKVWPISPLVFFFFLNTDSNRLKTVVKVSSSCLTTTPTHAQASPCIVWDSVLIPLAFCSWWLRKTAHSCLTGPLTLCACHLCVGYLLFLDSPSGRPPVSIFLHSGHRVAAVGNTGVLWKGTGDKNKLHFLPLAYQLYRVSATNRSHRPQTHKGSSPRPDTKGSTVTQQSKRQETKESPVTQNPGD